MKKRPLLTFFALTFAITWGLALVYVVFDDVLSPVLGPLSDRNPIYWVAVFSPSISALLLTAVFEGWAGVQVLLTRLVQWRFGAVYYALILIGIPLLGIITGSVAGTALPVSLAAIAASRFGGAGPLGEELGWRGFALPRLLALHNPLRASLILGTIWGVWHLPAFALAGTAQNALSLPMFMLGALALSVIATAVFHATQGSVLSAVLLHMMVNISINAIAGSFNAMTVGLTILALVIALGWSLCATPSLQFAENTSTRRE
ncbi:MAG: CPBP family intramembrane glutamic endopeptidase [bacterium]|nr:CPBP family intramembrane glutamic endopeptidase [bacterium]